MRKLWKWTWSVFLLTLGILGLLWGGKTWFDRNYQILDGRIYDLDAVQVDLSGRQIEDLAQVLRFRRPEVLDLRGTGITPAQRRQLGEAFPDCEILWQVYFQGAWYAPRTEEMKITSLSLEELEILDYIPGLRRVDARECDDYEALTALALRRPECQVDYLVPLGGTDWPADTRRLDLRDADPGEVERMLPNLPWAEQVNFCGKLPEARDFQELSRKFPKIRFTWSVDLGGVEADGALETLQTRDFRGLTLERLEEALPAFPRLRTLDLRGMDAPPLRKQEFEQRHPELEVLWDLRIGTKQVPLDTRILDLRGEVLESVQTLEENFPLLPELSRVELENCGLPNEALDELNRKYPDIRIVWNVNVGGRDTRTDETYFACNKWGLTMTDDNIRDLRYCTDMLCVDIGHSPGVTDCRWAAFMPHLRYLILADGNIEDLSPLSELKELVFLEVFQTPVMDYRPLLGCTALEDLNLCDTYGDPWPVGKMTWLKRLWWDPGTGATAPLADRLPGTQVMLELDTATGSGWRHPEHSGDSGGAADRLPIVSGW